MAPQSRLQHPGGTQHRQHSQVRRNRLDYSQVYNAQCNLFAGRSLALINCSVRAGATPGRGSQIPGSRSIGNLIYFPIYNVISPVSV